MSQSIQLSKSLGMLRAGVATPTLRIADVSYNVASILDVAAKARTEGVQVLSFTELGITGYTMGDLVQQQALLIKAKEGLQQIAEGSKDFGMLIFVGLPVEVEQKIFNCAAAVCGGRVLGIVPKTFLPSYKEYYETRWFSSSRDARATEVDFSGKTIPFGADILFRLKGIPDATIGVEVCEDMWIPLAPHERQAMAGATVLVNLSASNDILGKAEWRRTMISSESGRCLAATLYASSGVGESSNDVVYGGHAIIAEYGAVMAELKPFSSDERLAIADIDLERLANDRRVSTSFQDFSPDGKAYRVIEAEVADPAPGSLKRSISAHPFVPADPARRAERCRDIFSMQVAALGQKLSGSKNSKLVLGVSGGLDSTLALLVAVKTMDHLKLPRQNMYAYTLPGFGTTSRTRNNATKLCKALGVSFERIDLRRACAAHLRDLDHEKEDVVFENVQARYRTEFLFNKANEIGAIVLGTGDLTEVALGWSTFSGDQLSHYHVNCSVPKTLVQYLVRWVADEEDNGARKVLYDILDTPISPELLRPVNGQIVQRSEEMIGPVELADFYLYPFIRFGMRPGKMLYLANETAKQGLFERKYTLDELNRWLASFLRRFFANQFKRTCFPEGPKVGTVSLSPRGDWRMPSDAEPALWLEDLDKMYNQLKGSNAKSRR